MLEIVSENKYKSHKLVTCKKKYFRIVPFLVSDEGKVVYGTPSKVKKVNITRVKLKVKCVMQHPELPTGCEATALTIALNYHGFNVKKTTIVDKYLPKVPLGTMINIDNYFIGNPYSRGMGIYAPGLKKTANKYLRKKNTDLKAKDITGVSINEICKYVSAGYPVCVWSTININTKGTITYRWSYKGKNYVFSRYEHCITVIGFDKRKDTIIVADPTNGMCEHPRKLFLKRYKEIGKKAMVIMRKEKR